MGNIRTGEPTMIVVAAALVDRAGSVLLQRRPDGRQHGGLWEFPGGKVEPGESVLTALARELSEELGITVSPRDCQPLQFASDDARAREMLLLLFFVRVWSGVPAALDGQRLAWRDARNVDPAEMPPLDRPLLMALRQALGRDFGNMSASD